MSDELERLASAGDGPIAKKVTDARLLQILRSEILGLWPERKNDHFPAPLPVSLERKNFHKLQNYPYVICVKSDGMRYLMMCFNQKVYMVNRSFKFYEVSQHFDSVIYGSDQSGLGALFDGELIKNTSGSWVYIVHDCVSMCGRDVSKESFTARYEEVSTAIEHWNEKNSDFFVRTKKFYKFSEVSELKKEISSKDVDHKIDGLIFTPVTLRIGTQTQYTLFKWKPREKHTFDFKMVDSGQNWTAYVTQGRGDIPFCSVEKNSSGGKRFVSLLEKNCSGSESGDIIECDYNKDEETFDPIMIRRDKEHPNSLHTVEKTLLNIEENITMDEVLSLRE
jgi:hypothetical protein